MSKLKILITFFLFLSNFSSTIYAESYDKEYIRNFAKVFVEKNIAAPINGTINVTPATIDPRITIKPCAVPLSANIPEKHSSRNINVKIYCEGSTPWHMFLPVKVDTTISVLVALTRISKGTLLDSSNVIVSQKSLNKVRGDVFDELQTVIGARAKRSLQPGTNITRKNICVICKGENVTIIAQSDNFMIKTAGVALKDASFGEQIKVKNSRSGRIITAQVKTINQVVINL